MRQLCEHRPLGLVDRDALDGRLMVTHRAEILRLVPVWLCSGLPAAGDLKGVSGQEYMEALMNRTQRLEEMEVKEPGAALETEPSWTVAALGPAFGRTPSGECDPAASSSSSSCPNGAGSECR